jgi:hypothetical protein
MTTMANMGKLKRRSTLGAPPPPAEASPNLQAPETAPPTPGMPMPERAPISAPATSPRPARSATAGQGPRLRDGRSARRTGRTVQFATRVSPEFDERVRLIAEREGILLVEVLERALAAYEAGRSEE